MQNKDLNDMKKILVILSVFLSSFLIAQDNKKEQQISKEKLSEAIGRVIGAQLKQNKVPLDIEIFTKALKEEATRTTPSTNQEESIAAITKYEEQQFNKTSKKNLKEAEKFLMSL